MKISYVLPVYNGQHMIAQCLKSILKQNIPPHEIIVIDDASTDHTMRILETFRDQLTILFNHAERTGSAYCRNEGNFIATGDIIAVCDNDYYSPNRCNAIEEFFKKNKDKAIFCSGLELRSAKTPMEQWYMNAYEWDYKSKCPISHPTVAYKKRVAEEVKYHEDSIETDLYEFFLLDAYKLGYLLGGTQTPLMVKIEGDTERDRETARKLKKKKYEEYGIKVYM